MVLLVVLIFDFTTVREEGEEAAGCHAVYTPIKTKFGVRMLVPTPISAANMDADFVIKETGVMKCCGYFRPTG